MRRTVLLILAALLCAAAPAGAQEYSQTPVTVSKDKVRGGDGKVYYSHVVRERQTLFSIAKAYGVTVDEIYAANRELNLEKEGLKKDTILLIPIAATASADSADGKAKETAAGNPEETAAVQGQRTHVVKWYEDIEDIAAKYNVSAASIIKANNLKSRKLKARTVLVVPAAETAVAAAAGEDDTATAAEPEAAGNADTVATATRVNVTDFFSGLFSGKSSANAVLMLPFGSEGKVSGNNMDFYCGFLMGLRKLNGAADLTVLDNAGGRQPLTGAEMSGKDMVIGPISSKELESVAAMNSDGIPVISPLDQKAEKLAETYPFMIQVPTPYSVQYEDMADWIAEDRQAGDKVIIISESGSASGVAAEITGIFQNKGISFTPYSYDILNGRNAVVALERLATATGCNRVVIASENEAFVNDAVRNLSQLAFKKFETVLYSISRIRSYATIDIETFYALNMHTSLSYYIDYDSSDVMEFLMQYRALFGTEPSRFAFQGYDIANYFLPACLEGGSRWMERLPETGERSGLQSNYRFVKTENGGYLNTGVRRIVYNSDYSIRLLK